MIVALKACRLDWFSKTFCSSWVLVSSINNQGNGRQMIYRAFSPYLPLSLYSAIVLWFQFFITRSNGLLDRLTRILKLELCKIHQQSRTIFALTSWEVVLKDVDFVYSTIQGIFSAALPFSFLLEKNQKDCYAYSGFVEVWRWPCLLNMGMWSWNVYCQDGNRTTPHAPSNCSMVRSVLDSKQ